MGEKKSRNLVTPDKALLSHVSQSVATRFWFEHPEQAPEALRERFERAGALSGQSTAAPEAAHGGVLADLFNRDVTGLPQNEESISVCRSRPRFALGGTNDYRGLLDPQENFTGWHLSTDGGASVANEGLLPPVPIGRNPVASGGDPVDVLGRRCAAFASSLNYDPVDPFHRPNGIGIYRSSPARLASCPGGAAPSCWPNRRAAAVARPGHFLDKEWFDQGWSGSAGNVVWVTYTDFTIDDDAPLGFTAAKIFGVRCDARLRSCTDPILISGDDRDTQFSDVTIAPDGRVYVTWSEIRGELEGTPQTFIHKLRIAQPGSTRFGPERIIFRERRAIPFGGFLHANDFRIATYPKNDVAVVDGRQRVFVTWDACRVRLLDTICEEAEVKLTYSDNGGRTFAPLQRVSLRGDNYFPAIMADRATDQVAVAYFTNRRDRIFHNRQDVELVTLDEAGAVQRRQILTNPSNESEADPLLGGTFIGDYIEVFTRAGVAYTHYNANYRSIPLLGAGFPVAQQDNYLDIRDL